MNNWSVEKIHDFFIYLNKYYELSVNPEIEIKSSYKFPLQWKNGKILLIPSFFNDDGIKDDVRINLLLLMYSKHYCTKYNYDYISVYPEFMVKGICSELGFHCLSSIEIENNLRLVRRKLYQDLELSCLFKIGDILRESSHTKYEITKIERTKDDIFVTVKTIGYNLGNPEKVFTEEELFNRISICESIDNVNVNMRKNLFVLSAASGIDKVSILKEIIKQRPEFSVPVSVTTRKPQEKEFDSQDYYFISRDEFYDYQINGQLFIHNIYGGEFYGILFSEICKLPADKPIIIAVDAYERNNVLNRFPLSTAIFIHGSSFVESGKTPELLNESTEEEKGFFDYTVINEDAKKCADEIVEIIRNRLK